MNQDPIIHSLYNQPPTSQVPDALGAIGVGPTVLEKIAEPMPAIITGAHQSGTTINHDGKTGNQTGDKSDDIERDE